MDHARLIEKLSQQIPVFTEFVAALRDSGLTAWLVGGCVRDLLLGQHCADIDLVTVEDPSSWARSWARGRGHWFWLDQQRRQSRILLPEGVSFDIAPLRAATIEADLSARDFTVNALAVPIDESDRLIDPLNGINDLKNFCLRVCSDRSFSADPLRLLKGARHVATSGFCVDDHSFHLMTVQAPLINTVAAERVRDEFFLIMAAGDPLHSIQILSDAGVLAALFGCPEAEWLAASYRQQHRFLDDRIEDFFYRHQTPVLAALKEDKKLYLLSTLLRTYAPSRYVAHLHKLRLSRQQQQILKALPCEISFEWINRIDQLTTARRLALAVEQLNPCGLQRIFYWGWCLGRIPESPVAALLEAYLELEKNGRIPDLLDGHLIAQLVDNHHQIGRGQQLIKQQEIEGRVSHAEDALHCLKAHLPFDKK